MFPTETKVPCMSFMHVKYIIKVSFTGSVYALSFTCRRSTRCSTRSFSFLRLTLYFEFLQGQNCKAKKIHQDCFLIFGLIFRALVRFKMLLLQGGEVVNEGTGLSANVEGSSQHSQLPREPGRESCQCNEQIWLKC